MDIKTVLLLIPLLPLAGSAIAGLLRHPIGRAGAHSVTILAVASSFALSAWVAWQVFTTDWQVLNYTVYKWAVVDGIDLEVGFLIDSLTALMMVVVTFVSLMVLDACNGWWADPAAVINGGLYLQVADAIQLDGLADKHGVDGGRLLDRLNISYAGEVAIVDACERWWLRVSRGEESPPLPNAWRAERRAA